MGTIIVFALYGSPLSDQITRYDPLLRHLYVSPLYFRCPGVRSLSWRVHLTQWTLYRKINLFICPLNVAFSKLPPR